MQCKRATLLVQQYEEVCTIGQSTLDQTTPGPLPGGLLPTFALSLGDVEVGLLPELVALAEVAAEVVLVLHHVLGEEGGIVLDVPLYGASSESLDVPLRGVTLGMERQMGGAVGGVSTPGSLCSPLEV